jgi:hypothetical protein
MKMALLTLAMMVNGPAWGYEYDYDAEQRRMQHMIELDQLRWDQEQLEMQQQQLRETQRQMQQQLQQRLYEPYDTPYRRGTPTQ